MSTDNNNNLIDGKYKFSDIVDIEQLTKVFTKFSKATGFTIGLIDNNSLELLVKTGWHDICVNFHRADDEACKVCKKSNKLLFENLDKLRTVKIVECEHGLYDCATPIIIEGKHVANLATGQLLMREPDIKQFELQAEQFGFDKEKYLKALSEVPIIDRQEVTNMMEYLSELSIYIAKEGLNRLRTNKLNEELQKAKEQPEESEKRLKALHDASSGGISIHKHGVIIECNHGLEEMTGYTVNELIGMDVFLLIAERSRDYVISKEKSTTEEPYEAIGLRKSGEEFPMRLEVRNIPYKGEIVRTVEFRDLTEQKNNERALAAEKEQLSVTLRSIGDGVITTDTRGHVIMLNKVAEEMTEWSTKNAAGRDLLDIFNIVNQNTGKRCDNPVEKVLATGNIVELENHTVLISKNGKKIIIADSAAPIRNSKSIVIGVVLVFRDMTEKHKLEDSMQKTQKLESLGTLAGGIAHDFNNLLGGIFGYIEMAMEESSETNVLTYLTESLSSIDRAKALTQQLLTFAKGGTPIKRVEHLFPFVNKTVQFALSGTSVASESRIQDNLWTCEFDKNQIGQVIDNLTINAQQAMPNGGTIEIIAQNISLSKNEHPTLPGGNYVKLSIKDYGIGIPEKFLPLIFDPYYTTKAKGHGLGLASCFSIMHRHGGSIDVKSEAGQGSTFSIYLPASIKEEDDISKKNKKMHKGSGIFLVMDDEKGNRDIMKLRLKSFGYEVVLTENGQEAVDFFTSATKDNKGITAMIFDLTVPGGMGGKEAIREIRKISKDTPAFVASGYSSDPIMANPEKYGFNASICKPFMIDELSTMLDEHIKK